MKVLSQRAQHSHQLNLIRFLCFLLVFTCHFVNNGGNGIVGNMNTWWSQEFIQRVSFFGKEGVTLFFVLSGFLLSRILIQELAFSGKISIIHFYSRRVRRILPLYFLFLFLLLLINLVSNHSGFNSDEIPYLLAFVYNWGLYFDLIGGTRAVITWSLSIEAQLYLIFPLFLLFKVKNIFLYCATIFFVMGSCSLVFLEMNSRDSLYSTTSYLVPFSFGILMAYKENWFRVTSVSYSLITTIAFIYVLAYPYYYVDLLLLNSGSIHFYLTPIFFICLLHIIDKFFRENSFTLQVANLGKIGYGLYLYHFIVQLMFIRFNFFYDQNGFSVFGVLLALIVTIFISYFSYNYFEKFFLRHR